MHYSIVPSLICMKLYKCIYVDNILHVASQTWCLGRFLPLLVADMIPLDDEN